MLHYSDKGNAKGPKTFTKSDVAVAMLYKYIHQLMYYHIIIRYTSWYWDLQHYCSRLLILVYNIL